MTLIDFVRHGETVTPGRLLGRTDPELADAGWWQLEWQTQGRTWDLILGSPRLRSRAPVERLAAELGISHRIDDDWAELDFGDWDGRALAELRADPTTAEALAALYRSPDAAGAPGGESWQDLNTRIGRAVDRLLAEPAPATALVVTHAGPMRAALSLLCGIPFANLWAFKIDPGTRMTLRAGRDPGAGLWGEIVEVVQP
jgi:alpha-ribazole phosphatase